MQADCKAGEACVAGFCEKLQTERCSSNADCTNGACNLLTGACEVTDPGDGGDDGGTDGGTDGGDDGGTDGGTDGGDGGEDGGTDGGDDGGTDGGDGGSEPGGPCTTKYDCPDDHVCTNKKCVSAGGSCTSSEQCPRGEICDFTRKCVAGCEDVRDCPEGQLCHPNRYVCEVCSVGNPCPVGQVCQNEQCITPVTCSTHAQCDQQSPGTVCVDGQCTNCASHASCNVEPYNQGDPKRTVCATDGLCRAAVCKVEECEAKGEGYFCNSVTGTCDRRECVSDAECVQAGYVCDPLSFRCVVPNPCQGTDLTDCRSGCQAQGSFCDELRCVCYEGSEQYEPCVSDADCAQGLYCMLGLCDEVCEGSLLLGYRGSYTGNKCDTFFCEFSTVFFGFKMCSY